MPSSAIGNKYGVTKVLRAEYIWAEECWFLINTSNHSQEIQTMDDVDTISIPPGGVVRIHRDEFNRDATISSCPIDYVNDGDRPRVHRRVGYSYGDVSAPATVVSYDEWSDLQAIYNNAQAQFNNSSLINTIRVNPSPVAIPSNLAMESYFDDECETDFTKYSKRWDKIAQGAA